MSAFVREATVELSSAWMFSIDPDAVGVEEEWYDPTTTLPDFRTVEVPHVWQEHEELRDYTGTAWYRRSFSLESSDGRTLLRFGAVDYEATVWVNGTEVGSNRGGYLPFQFDITDALCDGENTVAVRVHDPTELPEIPHGKQGAPWYTRVSGIWQDVSLTEVPETHLVSARATPDLDGDTVTINVKTNDAVDCRAHIRVRQDGRTLGSANGALVDGTSEITIDLDDPAYWTPETPALCDFEVELATENEILDTYSDYFGMRSVTVEDGEWYLNGEPLSIRGALDQAYYPDTFYRPSGSISYRDEIETALDLGFNMLRKHIKPAHPRFLEWADRCGLLVWEEPANPNAYTERSKREVRRQFERLVQRDYNRPSVIVWSLYNEEWGIGLDQHAESEHPTRLWNDEDKQDYLASFYDAARELDPTRLICDNSGWAHVRTDVNDYHEYFVVPDRVDAWREQLDAIVADPGDNYATTRHDDPEDTPIVVSEFGTWGLPNVERLREHYGGDPHWFEHDFLEGLKRPAGIDARFEESALSDAFDDLPSLARAWQRRELGSIEALIRDMRTAERLSGYVITEFTDIEWEFNGILDYLREPKTELVDGFAANAPITAWAAPHDRVYWDDDSLIADLVVINDTPETTTVTVEWKAFGRSGTRTVEMTAHDTEQITGAIDIPIPSVDTPRMTTVSVRLPSCDVTASSDVVVVPKNTALPDVTVAVDNGALSDALAKRGYECLDSESADVTIRTDSIDDLAGDTLILPDANGNVNAVDGGSVTELPERESWNLCACFIGQTLFDDIDIVPGWAFDELYPYAYIDNPAATDDVSVAYAEGWIANHGAISMTRETNTGTLGICSLRVTDTYGEHPMATATLDRLLERFVESAD